MKISLVLCIVFPLLLAAGCATGPKKTTGKESSEQLFRFGVLNLLSQRNIEAQEGFQKACSKGDADSCKMLDALRVRMKTNATIPDGMPILECTDSPICFNSRKLYHGDYREKCNTGDKLACRKMAVSFLLSDRKSEAEALFQRNCDAGDMHGCVGMGLIKADSYKWKSASEFYAKACEAGFAVGCEKLGANEFSHGDKSVARKAWDTGCAKGYFPSCFGLVFWEGSDGAPIETKKTMFKKYCDRGDIYSCFAGVSQQPEEWPKLKPLWRKACLAGDYLTCGYYAFAFDHIDLGELSTGAQVGLALLGGAGSGYAGSQSDEARRGVLLGRPYLIGL